MSRDAFTLPAAARGWLRGAMEGLIAAVFLAAVVVRPG
jgi:hypothetical protein